MRNKKTNDRKISFRDINWKRYSDAAAASAKPTKLAISEKRLQAKNNFYILVLRTEFE
jgi:hypothetical protein